MNILFLHRNFPAQFRHILPVLANDKNNKVVFITNNDKMTMDNVLKVVYKLKREVPDNCHRYLRTYEESVIHGQSAAEAAIYLKEQGFVPDVIYAQSWGQALFIKDVFPDTPLLCYFEWFYDKNTGDVGTLLADLVTEIFFKSVDVEYPPIKHSVLEVHNISLK